MGTTNLTAGSGVPGAGIDKVCVRSVTLDFKANPVGANEVVQALDIPASTLVQAVYWKVLTAEGATCTCTIGDETDPDGYGASINLNSTSTVGWSTLALTTGTPDTVTGYTSGKLYTAADTIDLVMGHATDAAKVVVKAVCVNLG